MQQPLNLLSGQELLHAYTTSSYDFLGNCRKYYVTTGLGPTLATKKPKNKTNPQKKTKKTPKNHENGQILGE